MLFYGSIHSTPPGIVGEFNLGGYERALSTSTLHVVFTTIKVAVINTILSMLIATTLAWIIARTDVPYGGVLEVLISLPFFLPPILTAMAWGMLGNPTVGSINLAWRYITGSDTAIVNVYSYGGVVWHMMQHSIPFIFLLLVDAFRNINSSFEEASRMSGASPTRTLFKITLMLALPAILNAATLTLIVSIESFESALIFGLNSGVNVITTEIYSALNNEVSPQYQYGTALSFLVMVSLFLIILIQRAILGTRSYQSVTGKGFGYTVSKLGKWRWILFSYSMAFFMISVVMPISQLLAGSFFKFFGFYKLNMLTMENYYAVFRNRALHEAAANTFILAFAGATAAMILSAVIAYISVRTKLPGKKAVELLAWLPFLMPGIVLAIGFLWAFTMLPGPIQIYGTMWALLIAYITLRLPISASVMSAAYSQLSFDIEECSRVHGASWWRTLWRILIALTWPSFVVGWVIAFSGIIREVSASVLLYSTQSEVLSVSLLKLWSRGQSEQVAVIALGVMTVTVILRWAQLTLLKKNSLSA